jgi:hypothetical protein
LQVTDAHFEQAVAEGTAAPINANDASCGSTQSVANPGAAQYPAVQRRNTREAGADPNQKSLPLQGDSDRYLTVPVGEYPRQESNTPYDLAGSRG